MNVNVGGALLSTIILCRGGFVISAVKKNDKLDKPFKTINDVYNRERISRRIKNYRGRKSESNRITPYKNYRRPLLGDKRCNINNLD